MKFVIESNRSEPWSAIRSAEGAGSDEQRFPVAAGCVSVSVSASWNRIESGWIPWSYSHFGAGGGRGGVVGGRILYRAMPEEEGIA